MSFIEWLMVSFACVLIFFIGYAGVTGKSIFSFKDQKHNSGKHH